MNTRTLTREELIASMRPPEPIHADELAAIHRLLAVARTDSGQGRRAADFLLAWWNARSFGGFDLTDVWGMDRSLANDMVAVFGLVVRCHSYPDVYGKEIEQGFLALVAERIAVEEDNDGG